jgi:hypothetical protein
VPSFGSSRKQLFVSYSFAIILVSEELEPNHMTGDFPRDYKCVIKQIGEKRNGFQRN